MAVVIKTLWFDTKLIKYHEERRDNKCVNLAAVRKHRRKKEPNVKVAAMKENLLQYVQAAEHKLKMGMRSNYK
ncbi:MAG: hypothetical protein KGZ94_11225 [Clostridia bacterium]|jgi:hypothetical protein|nr:hypothetical protein [Clostridia bacterium]